MIIGFSCLALYLGVAALVFKPMVKWCDRAFKKQHYSLWQDTEYRTKAVAFEASMMSIIWPVYIPAAMFYPVVRGIKNLTYRILTEPEKERKEA